MCQTFKKYIQDRIQKSRNNINISNRSLHAKICRCVIAAPREAKSQNMSLVMFALSCAKAASCGSVIFNVMCGLWKRVQCKMCGDYVSVCKHLPCRMIGAGWLHAHTHESSPKDYLEKAVPVHSLCFGQGYVSLETSCGGKKRRHIAGTSAIAAMFSTGPKHASQRLFLTSSCDAEEFSRNEGFASIRIVLIHFAILFFWARASRGFALYAFCVPICLFGNLGGNKKRLENS